MCEDSILSLEYILVAAHGLDVVLVCIDRRQSLHVVVLCQALASIDLGCSHFVIVEGSRNSIGLVTDDVVGYTVAIIEGLYHYFFGRPWVVGPCVLLVLGLGHHVIEEALEWTLLSWWIRADVVCWIAWEGLSLHTKSVSLYFSIYGQSQLVSALGSSIWYLTQRNLHVVFISSGKLPVSMDIDINGGVPLNEVLEVTFRIYTRTIKLHWRESLVGPHWFRLTICAIRHLGNSLSFV